jgi:hypothetical protein
MLIIDLIDRRSPKSFTESKLIGISAISSAMFIWRRGRVAMLDLNLLR